MLLGLDGGLAARTGEGGFELGPQIRGLLTFGLLSLYTRYAWFPNADEGRDLWQFGAMFKIPLAAPGGFGPSAPWDMGERVEENP